eukprot:6004920-Amphidinium_carterae.1
MFMIRIGEVDRWNCIVLEGSIAKFANRLRASVPTRVCNDLESASCDPLLGVAPPVSTLIDFELNQTSNNN